MKDDQNIVLIVDDVEMNRAILHDVFCEEYRVMEAENGQEALEIIEQYRKQIIMIFLDIVMPVLDGFGVLQKMSEKHWIDRIPVFLITAEDSIEVINKGFGMGAMDVANKPFNPMIIRWRMKNILELYDHRFQMENIIEEQTKELKEQAHQLALQAEKLKKNSIAMIDALSTVIEFRDCESGGHIRRIRSITKALLSHVANTNSAYQFSEEQIEDIATASVMHDVGKIAVPDYILNKPGKLTKEEFEIMKLHTVHGCEILESIDYIREMENYDYYYSICRWHHEKWDGRGYPDGLKGEEIPIWVQVVAVADCYDALISERVYKPPFPHEKAVQMILDGECGAFNPVLMDSFYKASEILKKISAGQKEDKLVFHHEHLKPESANTMEYKEKESQDLAARALKLLEVERERYRALCELTQDVIFTYDAQNDIVKLAGHYQEVFGQTSMVKNGIHQIETSGVLDEEDRFLLIQKLQGLSFQDPNMQMELRLKTTKNKIEWFLLSLRSIWEKEKPEKCITIIGKLTNIDKQKSQIELWKQEASLDPLTGVIDHNCIEEVFNNTIQIKEMQGAFLLIDIDHFRNVNNLAGHARGDEILIKTSKTISEQLNRDDYICRAGGDEFVVVLAEEKTELEIFRRVQQICEAVNQMFAKLNLPCTVTISIGISRFPEDGNAYKKLLKKAEMALYAAKKQGKNIFMIYYQGLEDQDHHTLLSKIDESSK